MPDQRISYRVNPLPQAEVPQRPSKPSISQEPPENLYKPPSTKTRQSFQPAPTTVWSSPSVTNPISSPVAPSRPAPDPRRLQRSESQTIAQHMRNDSDSTRLEQLLRRQESKRYEPSQKPSRELLQLSIVRRPDQRYQIVLSFNQQSITHQVFRTLKHCAEAAAELEQRFEFSIVADRATAEAMEAIVRAAVMREWVELRCAVA